MALGIMHDPRRELAAYYDSVTGTAFGVVFSGIDAEEQARHFAICWLTRERRDNDPRALSHDELERQRLLWKQAGYLTEDGMLSDTGYGELP